MPDRLPRLGRAAVDARGVLRRVVDANLRPRRGAHGHGGRAVGEEDWPVGLVRRAPVRAHRSAGGHIVVGQAPVHREVVRAAILNRSKDAGGDAGAVVGLQRAVQRHDGPPAHRRVRRHAGAAAVLAGVVGVEQLVGGRGVAIVKVQQVGGRARLRGAGVGGGHVRLEVDQRDLAERRRGWRRGG